MQLKDYNDLILLKSQKKSFYIYFSAPGCSVCEVLHPKLLAMFNDEFPKLQEFNVNTKEQPDIAAQERLLTNPSLLVYIDGQEVIRRSKVISIDEVSESLKRYYSLFF
jgi:thioredoxin-like negative regulator of GroEL